MSLIFLRVIETNSNRDLSRSEGCHLSRAHLLQGAHNGGGGGVGLY